MTGMWIHTIGLLSLLLIDLQPDLQPKQILQKDSVDIAAYKTIFLNFKFMLLTFALSVA